MKVLFVATAYPTGPEDARGAHIHRLARSLVRRGCQVTVVAPGLDREKSIDLDGVQVHLFRYWGLSRGRVASGVGGIVPAIRQHPQLALQLLPLVIQMFRAVKRETKAAHVVHSHWILPCSLIVRLVGAPAHVATAHGADVNTFKRFAVTRRLLIYSMRGGSINTAVSDSLRQDIHSLGCPDVITTPLGIEVPDVPKEDTRHSDGTFRLVYVGSLIRRKNVRLALEAVRMLKERGEKVSLTIVGDGPEAYRLKEIVDSQFLPVTFCGELPPSEAQQMVSRSHALVLPSISEGRPTVVLEAMASGAIVVASRIPGTSEMIEHEETGLLFESGNTDQLAMQIERLLADPQLVERIRGAARRSLVLNGWTIDAAAERFVSIYQRAGAEV